MAETSLFSFHDSTPQYRQGGMALIMLVFVLCLFSLSLWLKRLDSANANIQRTAITYQALANAQNALVSYAMSSDSVTTETSPRPGNFPCPDANGDGSEEGTCSASNLGRIPWKTLGLTEDMVRDGSGEVIWYSVSGNFRRRNIVANRISSDTKGTLMVFSDDGTTSLTPAGWEGVAVVIAPGPPVNGQVRGNDTAANFLESKNGINNATVGGPFIDATETDVYNDKILVIRTQNFMPQIEQRVARELKTLLQNYYAANHVYPFPAKFDSCGASCDSNDDVCSGRIPLTAQPVDWTDNYLLPQWFMTNRWYRVIPYAVDPGSLATPVTGCTNPLTVSSVLHKVVFFMPGRPPGAVNRTTSNTLSDYLEDPENNDEWGAFWNHSYVNPTAISNDHLYVLD